MHKPFLMQSPLLEENDSTLYLSLALRAGNQLARSTMQQEEPIQNEILQRIP